MPLKRLKHSIAIAALCSIISCPATHALRTSYYASNSKLASGMWVKVGVSKEGIYQLTYDQLREMGFSNPENVQVYGYGSTILSDNSFSSSQPEDVVTTPTLHTEDGRLLFYGQGDVTLNTAASCYTASSVSISRSWYDTRSYYFLHEVDKVEDIPTTAYSVNTNLPDILTNHIHTELYENDNLCPGEGGIGFVDFKMNSGQQVQFTYNIKNYEASSAMDRGSLCSFVAISSTTKGLSASLEASDDVTTVATSFNTVAAISDSEYKIYCDNRGYLSFTSPKENTSVTFTLTAPSTDMNYCAFDRNVFRYPRANRLDQDDPFLIMGMLNIKNRDGQVVSFPNTTPEHVRLWNVTSTAKISAMQSYYDEANNCTKFTLCKDKDNNSPAQLVAFDPTFTNFASPEVVGTVDNQNLHGMSVPDMLIITTKDLKATAEEVAELHRKYQGMDVAVVVHDDIYNEFSSGARDAMAYRRFAKMFYDRDSSKFKYLMFWGPVLYDNRSVTVPYQDRMVCFENVLSSSTNYVTNYTSDAYFAMLQDTYNYANIHYTPMLIAVGRVPASSASEAQSYLNKVRNHFENTPGPEIYAHALTIGGEGDNNTHLSHAVQTANEIENANPNISAFVLPLQLYEASDDEVRAGTNPTRDAQVQITDDMLERGLGFMSFSGHGGPKYVSTGGVLNVDKATSHSYKYLPYMMFSSCDQFSFDRQLTGLVQSLIFSNTGGAIAAVGACRAVYIAHNQLSCGSIARAYAEAKPGDTYGEAYVAARQILLDRYTAGNLDSASNGLVNVLSYNLAGDPALPIPVPELTANLFKVGQTLIADEIKLEPLKEYTYIGYITDADGNVMTDFNGDVTIELLDGPMTATTYNSYYETAYNHLEMTITNDVLATGHGKAVNGEYKVTMSTPIPNYPDGVNHMSISAVETDGTRTALGVDDRVNITDLTAEQLASREFTDPEIHSFYAGSEDAGAGCEVGSTVEINATFTPGETGLRVANGGIGTSSSLCIDDVRNVTNLVPSITTDADGLCTLQTSVSGLSEGYHTITLTVVNNAGLVARQSIDVIVVTRNLEATLSVDEQPARTSATINLEGVSVQTGKIRVSDIEGNTVFSASNVTFPYTWNLRDNKNQPVANGRYNVSALISNDSYYGHTPAAEIIVLK